MSELSKNKREPTEYELIEREYDNGLLPTVARKGLESDILDMFKTCIAGGVSPADEIPLSPALDTIIYEMSFKHGRADIVIFHVDGSASVIEVKDGTRGYNHVVSGIGQAGLYAVQLNMRGGALSKVRKCLLWTSTGNLMLDALIGEVCEQANMIPLPWADMDKHMSIMQETTRRVLAKISEQA